MKFLSRLLPTAAVSALTGLVALAPSRADADPTSAEQVREITIVVDGGYQPDRVEVAHGEHVQLKFVRKDPSGCTREVVFQSLGIQRELPYDQPVVLRLPPLKPGEYEFRCGMDMLRGKIVVRRRGA
jgi:plastocyanin domain-containing protein